MSKMVWKDGKMMVEGNHTTASTEKREWVYLSEDVSKGLLALAKSDGVPMGRGDGMFTPRQALTAYVDNIIRDHLAAAAEAAAAEAAAAEAAAAVADAVAAVATPKATATGLQ